MKEKETKMKTWRLFSFHKWKAMLAFVLLGFTVTSQARIMNEEGLSYEEAYEFWFYTPYSSDIAKAPSGVSVTPERGDRTVIYFDLAAGNVVIDATTYSGYIFQTDNGTTKKIHVSGGHSLNNEYYVYQSQNSYSSATGSYCSTTGLVDGTMIVPTYDEMTIEVDGVTKTWTQYITNQNNVEDVITNWETAAQAVYKTTSQYQIKVSGNSTYTLIIDGVWSSFYKSGINGPVFFDTENAGQMTLKVKGDNRISNLYYSCTEQNTGKLFITSYEGDGSDAGSLTVANLTPNCIYDNFCLIGPKLQLSEYGLTFNGATVFAGFPPFNNYVWESRANLKFPVCVGGGSNSIGEVTINGGTLTAVSNGTTAAIGGGGGYDFAGGYGLVTITGGHVYAYAHGIYSINPDCEGYVPTTAIGGASTFKLNAKNGTIVSISGDAYVYAESVGGCAIGGGNARNMQGGDALITIEGNAHVEARSVAGVIENMSWNGTTVSPSSYNIPAGSAMGGGVGRIGGYAEIWIKDNCVLDATSIGGGDAVTSQNLTAHNGGSAEIHVLGGTTTVDYNIGGGNSTGDGVGGDATIVISGGTMDAGTIGGGNSITKSGGTANVTVTGGSLSRASIGGGNSTDGAGGYATINVSDGTFVGGSIGGGDSQNGNGGDASIYITGGTLDCTSIGGGDSEEGAPGSVSAPVDPENNPLGAGIFIASDNKIVVKSGYIGGGTNVYGDVGFATAYINATHSESTIQGQFILANSDEGRHCFFIMEDGTIDNTDLEDVDGENYPRAKAEGGAVYMVDPYGAIVNISGGTIRNATGTLGGAVYMSDGSFTLSDSGMIEQCSATVQNNPEEEGRGGAVYLGGGAFQMTGGTIQNNQADADGGGLYLGNGTITLSGATVDNNHADDGNGGGIYAGGGSMQVLNLSSISNNSALFGGGVYANSDMHISGSTLSNNTADWGGGLFIPECNASLDFSSGSISGNQANHEGGGLYLSEGATLTMTGEATFAGNHVPADGKGGAIYLDGTLLVGGGSGTQSLRVDDNYAGTPTSLNNVYLPHYDDVITLMSDISAQEGGNYLSHIGFSVEEGFCPVIEVLDNANTSWLTNLMPGSGGTLNGAVFDDKSKYIAIYETEAPFNELQIFLWGCWTTVVDKDPMAHLDEFPLPQGVSAHYTVENGEWHIYTPQGLAWFTSFVNNLNGCTGNNRGTSAVIESDISMAGYVWVPIGAVTAYDSESSQFTESNTTHYTGTFDGQGHVINSIQCSYLTGITKFGLFGSLNNATVTNTFLDNYTYTTTKNDVDYTIGGIAGRINSGTLSNCEARGTVTAVNCGSNSVMGGLVGRLDGGSVHSSMAMPTVEAGNISVGGLAGYLASGTSVKNSFVNGEFNGEHPIGGLVGNNSGTVENCYVRMRGTAPDNFAWFAGTNTGTIEYCYAPRGANNYLATPGGTLARSGNYAPTSFVGGNKYGFAHQDQSVSSEPDNIYKENGPIDNQGRLKGLLSTLNNWVAAQTDGVVYSTWTRTMASPVNGDYPILEFNDFVCAGSRDNVFVAYKTDLNDMIEYANGNSAGGSIYLYKPTPTSVSSSTNYNVRVYIEPNIGILQSSSNVLNARVGITLDNSSADFMDYDWHMFSSPLRSVPMGLNYYSNSSNYYIYSNYSDLIAAGGISDVDYNDPTIMDPPHTMWDNNRKGYFPTNTPYPCFDFYTFNEPVRHWINFKREGAPAATSSTGRDFYDHWSQYVYNPETDLHANIRYENETSMVLCKGYMLALTAPSMLMADGVLNSSSYLTYKTFFTEDAGFGYSLRGLNLIGNPYQSYLDFDMFEPVNGIDTYYILDADAHGYIAYTCGQSENPNLIPGQSTWPESLVGYRAERYIHPHQGFMVRTNSTKNIYFLSIMRCAGTNETLNSDFREESPRYPLVAIACTDAEGRNDFTTLELDRPEVGGGEKAMGLHAGDASVWFHLDDTNWQTAFTTPGLTSAPLRFKAYADGTFTLRWGTANASFNYLHLIDNITGADIDCLRTNEYVFEGRTSDYTSRFRLVFEFTGIEEPDAPETDGPTTFAFMMGDELVVNGEGLLQVFDLNGRLLMSSELHGSQNTVSMPVAANGVYMLRLTSNNQARTQKMVINR